MTQPLLPTLDLLPLHGAIVAQQPLTLDVLVRITPPPVTLAADRLPLNLSLVIDRSGSMRGQKMHYARQAARLANDLDLTQTGRYKLPILTVGAPIQVASV